MLIIHGLSVDPRTIMHVYTLQNIQSMYRANSSITIIVALSNLLQQLLLLVMWTK